MATPVGPDIRPPFRIVENPNGTFTVEDTVAGEVMHSRIGAWEEAQLLYIEGSAIRERLQSSSLGQPLRVADVGMGIAANAWAAIEAAQATPGSAIRLLSFENALGGILTALDGEHRHPGPFPWLLRAEALGAFPRLLETGQWRDPSGHLQWDLRTGDFFTLLKPEDQADLIFWDFYAPKSCESLWSIDAFRRTRPLCAKQGRLHTYSSSTATRAALILAGWYVGYGRGTNMKSETTVASLDPAQLEKPLGARWIEKIRHSTKPFPLGDREDIVDFATLERKILASEHGQRFFSG